MDNVEECMFNTAHDEVLQNKSQVHIDFEPKLGLEFDNDDEVINFYNEYARRIGFSTRKEYANTSKKFGYVTSRKMTCFKEGFRGYDKRRTDVKNPQKQIRSGCQAHVVIARQPSGKYRITKVDVEHNHPLVPPSMVHMLPSHRQINQVHADAINLAEDAGLLSKATFDFMSLQAGGRENLGYTKQDQKNYLRTKREKAMKGGEAGALLEYFEKKRTEDPSFFFVVQLDVDDMITNIFWADSKMIMDCEIFGDVLSFDTTYRTNREYRPLASFVGWNNHRKIVIFGGALMYDETSESFQWLFETFLRAMSGKRPCTIFTDQDAAMNKAISIVMPEVHHKLCVWHMEQNATKHLNQVYKRYASFRGDFRKCIYEYEDEEEFIDSWNNMLDKYGLRENEWLQGIYALREKLFVAYRKQIFSGGMNSTQLSESLNGDLKDYLQSDYNLVQFFKHYYRAIEDKRYNELQDTCDASQRLPVLKVEVPILAHAREVYTPNIFVKFQDEYMSSLLIRVNDQERDNSFILYKVSKHGFSREHTVKVGETSDIISCSCMKFESMGILCCHTIRILDVVIGVTKIPFRYILKRWMKNAKDDSIREIDGQDIEKDPKLIRMNRYKVLCPIFVRIAAKASETDEGFKLAVSYANDLSSKMKQIMDVTTAVGGSPIRSTQGEDITKEVLTRAKSLKRKKDGLGRRKKRVKSSLELNPKRKRSSGKESSSTSQDNPAQIYDSNRLGYVSHFNQDSVLNSNIIYHSDISAVQNIARTPSSQHSELSSLSMAYPSFTQMMMEPLSFHTFQHFDNSSSHPNVQANNSGTQEQQIFQNDHLL